MELCVALDLPSMRENLELVEKIKEYDVWLKVGFRSYIRDGKEFLVELKKINKNFKIFLDLKLYDIPNTMADAAESIVGLGVDMFNIHASAGEKAMKMVMDRVSTCKERPLVFAVTALTSFSDDDFQKIYSKNISACADEFAISSYKCGLDGVVCSAFESSSIKSVTDEKFMTLTPGIRPFGEDAQDQQRVADISKARDERVDFIVVGRPIYKSQNPAQVVEKILKSLN